MLATSPGCDWLLAREMQSYCLKIPPGKCVPGDARGKKRGEYVESFSVPATEVRDIMNALNTISNGDLSKMKVRFYKAVNDKNEETLVISVADAQGKDVTYYKDKNGDLQSALFDFTRPCPSTCDGEGTGEFNSGLTKR